jgi:hypothetical protein
MLCGCPLKVSLLTRRLDVMMAPGWSSPSKSAAAASVVDGRVLGLCTLLLLVLVFAVAGAEMIGLHSFGRLSRFTGTEVSLS